MNNRIKHFVAQAGTDVSGKWMSIDNAQMFAKLIVAECVKDIESWRDATDEHMYADPYWQGYRHGCNDSIVEIQNVIRVEE